MPFNHQGMRLIYANIPVIMSAFKISISTSKIIIFFHARWQHPRELRQHAK